VHFLSQEQKPKVPEKTVQWSPGVQIVLFLFSLALAVVTSIVYETKNKRKRLREAWLRCRRCRLSDPQSADLDARTSESDELMSSQEPSMPVSESESDTSEPMSESEPDRVVRRQEFILVGLLHWCLVVMRQNIWRQRVPHNFNVLGVRFKSMAMDNRTTAMFHEFLTDYYKLTLPTDEKTIFDSPYKSLDRIMLLANIAEYCALLLLALAAIFQLRGHKQCSVRCIMFVGFFFFVAALLPFLPNYLTVLNLGRYYEGCGPKFDKFIKMTLNVVFGSGFAIVAGWMMFAHLFSLPISFVRGLWLLLLKPPPGVKDPQHGDCCSWLLPESARPQKDAAEEPNRAATDGSGLGEELMGILSIAMRYLACIIPLITAFPLLFAFQAVEDYWSWRYLVAFWVLPQVWVLAQKSSCSDQGATTTDAATGAAAATATAAGTNTDATAGAATTAAAAAAAAGTIPDEGATTSLIVFAYRDVQFYFVWLLIYATMFVLFLHRQFDLLDSRLWEYVWNMDWPLAWSWMHMDFCLMNVLITDIVCGIISHTNPNNLMSNSATDGEPLILV